MKDILVTYCIFTYNQENYIKECIESILKIEYNNMEIVISDDCSKDSTFKILKEITDNYIGKHKIILNRNEKNLGIGAHFEKIYGNFCNGKYIFSLGGDDIVDKDYIKEVVERFEKNSNLKMIDVSGKIIDGRSIYQKDIELSFNEKIFSLKDYLNINRISTFAPGRAFTRDVISNFAPINSNCPTEDSVLVFRSLLLGNVCRLNIKVILYRIHGENISSSEGLKKMDHSLIIDQQSKDLEKCFDDEFVTASNFKKTKNRLRLESLMRGNLKKSKYIRTVLNYTYRLLYKLNLLV